MAEGGNDNKLVMELDLDTKNFQVKLNGIAVQTAQLGTQGKQSFSGMQLGLMSFNAALEIASKTMAAFKYAIEQIEYADKFSNQARALSNLSNSIGVNSKTLLESVNKSAGGSLSSISAQKIAFDALNSGIEAKNIPTLVKLASAYSGSGRVAKSTEQVMQDFSRAIETGNTAMLKQYGIAKVSGDRMAAFNAVVNDGSREIKDLGSSFESTGSRMEAAFDDMLSSAAKGWGAFIGDFGKPLVTSNIEKAADQIKRLELEINRAKEATANGTEAFEAQNVVMQQGLPPVEALEKLEKMLVKARADLAVETEKDTEAEKARNEELSKGVAIQKSLTDAEVQRIQARASVRSLEIQAANEKADQGMAEVKTMNELQAARRRRIELEAQEGRQLAESKSKTAAELEGRLIAIDFRRRKRIEEIQQSEQLTNDTRRQAELNYLEENAVTNEQYMQRKVDRETQIEEERHNRRVLELSQEKMDKEQYRTELEIAETEHQERMQKIRDQYHKVSAQNFSNGLKSGLASLNDQYGNFTKVVQRSTMATHGIMTRGFVAMAKGHKDAMDQMLKQFLEMIGTEMIQSGTLFVFEGLATANPQKVGIGSAMIGAGMALVGASGGGAGASADAGGGYGGGATQQPGIDQAKPEDLERKSAKIIINGDFLNTQEAANHLAEVLRKNSDVTDYAIVAQGRNYA